ncbi:cysteine-rich receptor-like protein kinase 7 [Rosa chinensis]|uniref:cysteine-rich receptor-like protein kinase 7 n=1 Tax=Rosa chinensis TaxID=74649 RepID=UPI000D08C78A|nr:cysteine-rich receptor-like protein kinase 7 [Rosa chinensis]
MARIFTNDEQEANTMKIVGTRGYMSPEYVMGGNFSIKSDVYSFGVLMLEILSGRKNNSFYNDDHAINKVGYAWALWREGAGLRLTDPRLGDSCDKNQFLSREHNETSGIAFLEYWLCKFIFCTSSCKPTGAWTLLATALYNGLSIRLGQPVLGALYRTLYQATMHPFETSISGPFWILDFWIQAYFPFFRGDDILMLPPTD